MNRPRHTLIRRAAILDVLNHLTDRDRDLIDALGAHQVLTTHQIARAWFTSPERARARLAVLHHLDVLTRFRQPLPSGSAPFHYLLGYNGACLHAAATGTPWPRPATIAERAARIAGSPKLAHTLGVNDFLTHLLAHTRTHDWHLAWHNETQAAERTGGMVKPDAHATITTTDTRVEFYYEHDTGSEDHNRLAAKLERYRHLIEPMPVLIELSSSVREANLHKALSTRTYPFTVATTHTGLSDRPAGSIWTPLHGTGSTSILDLGARR
ncbi:hypothetical protein Afil01_44050 [Actinorhabdospora filicis]|uniref:Protein involved in plasmid replication-relaxation n=1 Tax=Actinorhabdospora filicis TaxID=1785913 RepID=A0A9W6WB11_9ACTN|nr:replication-relaxation family protein [Actinorhabdospora filicis]GLZ79598.1 hypothetical protein Afil01_44050 [Actinorhabdospora filicis]